MRAAKANIQFRSRSAFSTSSLWSVLRFACLATAGPCRKNAAIFKVANVTIRDVTERPETIECGSNMLSGAEPETILRCVRAVLQRKRRMDGPTGISWIM